MLTNIRVVQFAPLASNPPLLSNIARTAEAVQLLGSTANPGRVYQNYIICQLHRIASHRCQPICSVGVLALATLIVEHKVVLETPGYRGQDKVRLLGQLT